MRILIISEYFPRNHNLQFSGGVEARNFYIAKNLSKKHDVTVLTKLLADSKEKESMFGFSVIRAGNQTSYKATASALIDRLSFIFRCIKASRDINADIVEGSNFVTHFIAKLVAREKKIPSIAWYPDVWIGSWIKNAGIVGIFGEVLERVNLWRGFTSYITISLQTKNKLQNYIKDSIAVIPCGIDPEEYKHNVKKQNNKVICISRLASYKNIKDLIFAFAIVHSQLEDSRLTIIGEGPEKQNLENLIKNLKLGAYVSFYQNLKRKDLIQQLEESKIFCLPSKVEGFGISIVESAAAGTPYVVSDIPVFAEVTHNFLGGESCEVGNINQLAQQLQKFLSNEKLYNKKISECKKLATLYNWEIISRETERVYKTALSSK